MVDVKKTPLPNGKQRVEDLTYAELLEFEAQLEIEKKAILNDKDFQETDFERVAYIDDMIRFAGKVKEIVSMIQKDERAKQELLKAMQEREEHRQMILKRDEAEKKNG